MRALVQAEEAWTQGFDSCPSASLTVVGGCGGVASDELVEQTAVVAYACRERSRRSLVEYAEATEVLASVLVCSPRTAAAMALKCPDVLTQSMSRTMMLMVWFKEVLPSADISAMLQNEPSLLTMVRPLTSLEVELLRWLRLSPQANLPLLRARLEVMTGETLTRGVGGFGGMARTRSCRAPRHKTGL